MSINIEPFYKLTKIGDLPKAQSMSLVQLVGKIEKIMDSENVISIKDTTGKYSLKYTEDMKNVLKENSVVRVFGRWDGMNMSVEKIIEWDIPFEKMELLFI